MFNLIKLFFVVYIHIILVQSFIPDLSVKTVDNKVIQRKRLDTLEMCRLFEENNRQENANHHRLSKPILKENVRRKRDLDSMNQVNPEQDVADEVRVENIVDKLYDDLTVDGIKVPYRQKKVTTTALPLPVNETARRLFFAPASLLGVIVDRPEDTTRRPDRETRIAWPKYWKHGVIPYFIDPKTYDNQLSEMIVSAFDYFEKATCIRLQRLREKPDQRSLNTVEWVYITNPGGVRQCVHSNENIPNKGVQMVVLGYDCLSQGEIVHEVMHTLGFSHEHTRPDRDQHVTILWDNIKPGYKRYFDIRKKDILLSLPYDYSSVLHYPPRAFSRNGQITIMTETKAKIGQRQGLSEMDVEKINTIFGVDCVKRNKQYLLTTCPSVVQATVQTNPVPTPQDIVDYFKDRIWQYGIVNYKLRDQMEFSAEERENILAVIRHIEKETCIEFRNVAEDDDDNGDVETLSNTNNKEANNNNEDDEITVLHVGLASSSQENETAKAENNPSLRSQADNELVQPRAFKRRSNKDKQPKREATSAKPIVPALLPKRRHVESFLVLTRSPDVGCKCPKPGKPSNETSLEIQTDCFNTVNDLLHLFVHVLGLDHQHNMHDRDHYLHIVWQNLTDEVKADMENKLPPAASLGLPYDYQSVMHFPWLQIKNGVTNIMYPVWNDGWAMGHWQGLSSTDVQKINALYREQCTARLNLGDDNGHGI